MKADLNHIFKESSCLSHDDMKNYLFGNLSDTEKRRVEVHITDCEMCNDELEGLSNITNIGNLGIITRSINSEIDEFLTSQSINKGSSSRSINFKRIFTIAASVAILITAGYFINYYINSGMENMADMSQLPEKEFLEEFNTESADVAQIERTEDSEFDKSESELADQSKIQISDNIEFKDENKSLLEKNRIDELKEDPSEDLSEEVTEFEIAKDDKGKIKSEISTDDVSIGTKENEERKKKEVVSVVSEDVDIADVVPSAGANEKSNEKFFATTRRGAKTNKTSDNKEVEKYRSIRASALLAYSEKSYADAALGFSKYLEYKPNDLQILFKSGVSNYYLAKYNSAIKNFDKVINGDLNRYVEDAEWFKAMSLIKIEKKTEAKKLLNKIVSDNGKYQNKALDVLNQID